MINKFLIKVLILLETIITYVISKNISRKIRSKLIIYRYITIDLICELKFKDLKK